MPKLRVRLVLLVGEVCQHFEISFSSAQGVPLFVRHWSLTSHLVRKVTWLSNHYSRSVFQIHMLAS